MKIEDLKTIITPILAQKELFLVDMKITPNNVIEIFVDALQGVNIQTCIEVSRQIEEQLDRDEEDFELTVSSAGIGYPFLVDGQYQKNLDKTVEVKLTDQTKLSGTLKAFDPQSITLEYEEKKEIEGKKKKELVQTTKVISRKDIKEIKDVVKF